MAGIPSLETSCVCQKPTPAINDMASSVVKLSTNSATLALAIWEEVMVNFKGPGSPIYAEIRKTKGIEVAAVK